MKRALLALAALLSLSSGARADEPPPAPGEGAPPTEAERLFEQGRGLLAGDDWTSSCALFDASARLSGVPAVLVKVARCRAHEGRLAQAIEVYERALAGRPWPELDRLIRAELFEVERRTPRIRVTLLAPTAGVTIRRNGRPLPAEALQAGLFTDVGAEEHLSAEARGYRTAAFDLKATAEAEQLELRVTLESDAPAPPPLPPPPDLRRPAGWALGGGGVLALAVGAGFGVDYLLRRGSLYDGCVATLADGRHVCPPSTAARYDDTVAARTRTIALLGAGAALLGGGAALLLTAPRREGEAPRVSASASALSSLSLAIRPGGLDLGGRF